MKFVSTRGGGQPVSFTEALQTSIAADGGLFVPEKFPSFDPKDFSKTDTLAAVAEKVAEPFLQGDPLAKVLPGICRRAFDFPVPLGMLADQTAVLELFHGPTAAFKDVGARFLAECVVASSQKPRTVLVATSGDTGGAVAAAFFGKPGIEVVVLFPKGRISPRQEKQLTCWGGNVRAFAVRGTFDDCQRLAKEAFAADAKEKKLLSANSINIARILPQTFYYALASLQYQRRSGSPAGLIIPSGNLGNSVAAFWAKKMGFPIREIVIACNANRPVVDTFANGVFKPQPTIATLANAMDVGNPSNMERLLHLYPSVNELKKDAQAFSVSDEEIRQTIRQGRARWGRIWCPHTATAAFVREKLPSPHWILVATADPAKFDTIVEPLIGETVPVTAGLAAILSRPSRFDELEPELAALQNQLHS